MFSRSGFEFSFKPYSNYTMTEVDRRLRLPMGVFCLTVALSSCAPDLPEEPNALELSPRSSEIVPKLSDVPKSQWDRNIVYGLRDNQSLMMDVVQPVHPNGKAILAIQSGAWHSNHFDATRKFPVDHVWLARGYTIFVIWHSNPPSSKVPEVVADVQRAVRFIHAHAHRWKVDPTRLAAFGLSSGGHLSLMLATSGDDGNPMAEDPIERQSSRIHTAMVINAPSDLRGWTTSPPPVFAAIPEVKVSLGFSANLESDYSPITLVDAKAASIFLIHGDDDAVVSLQQSENFYEVLKQNRVKCRLAVIPDGKHAFTSEQMTQTFEAMLEWLEEVNSAAQ